MDTEKTLDKLIEDNNGYLITCQAVAQGISKPALAKYIRLHNLEKVAHGIYILDDVWPDELFILQSRNREIIYCGETALYLHGLTDKEYNKICFGVPVGYNASHINIKNKKVQYLNPDIIKLGICEVASISRNPVRAYDKERCICDIIKGRKKYEVQVFQTAIKEYMTSKDKKLSNLIQYADRLGIRDEVMKYVEVLL